MQELRDEIKRLQEELANMEASVEGQIAEAVAKAISEATASLREELAKAYAEIERLNAIINKNSTNSSKPPSMDESKEIPNSRKRSGKPRGGQKGHPGRRLGLPENIEELEQQGLAERRIIDYTNGNSEYISKFTIDIEVKVIVTEYRFSKTDTLPEALTNEVSYGDNLKAATVLLLTEGMIADKRLSDIISGLTHGAVNLSTATMCNFQTQFAQKLEESGEIGAIKQDLLNGKVMNTDDTSMRSTVRVVYPKKKDSDDQPTFEQAERKSFKVTIRTYSNERSTYYTVNPKKDKEGVERDGVLPNYMGILSHDHESKFYNYGEAHATCGEHLWHSADRYGLSINCQYFCQGE